MVIGFAVVVNTNMVVEAEANVLLKGVVNEVVNVDGNVVVVVVVLV